MQVRGRHLVVAWMTVFLVVAAVVVVRTQRGFDATNRVRALQRVADSLVAERANVMHALGPLTGDELRARATALGLRVVSDSDLVVLTLPPVR